VPLEISLTPASGQFYELEGGPVRVTAPGAAEPEKVVWARVRAQGDRGIVTEGRSGELISPALNFQGRMKVGTVKTPAYGQECRVTDTAVEVAKKMADEK
jgi:hypothetical protein